MKTQTPKNKTRDNYSSAKRGKRNPRAKVTPAIVRAIRREEKKTGRKYGWKSALARKYGVTPGCIGDILSGRRWGHVT